MSTLGIRPTLHKNGIIMIRFVRNCVCSTNSEHVPDGNNIIELKRKPGSRILRILGIVRAYISTCDHPRVTGEFLQRVFFPCDTVRRPNYVL